MNKPASLTAGVCSLCITASLIVAPPHAAAAAPAPVAPHRAVSVVDQPYDLTAASAALQNLLLVAGIPFNNLNTTLSTLGGLTNFVTGLNQALGNIYKGNWDQVQAGLQKAWNDEVVAFQKVLALPQTLIKYDATVIRNFLGSVSGASATLASTNKSVTTTAAALPTAQSPSASALLVVLGIPFNNLNTTLSTLGGLTNFVTGLNLALGNIYKGNWDQVPANLQKAWTDEVAAFKKVLALPQTLLSYNAKAIGNLFNPASATATAATFVQSERVSTLALPTAKTSIEAGTPTSADEVTGTKKDAKDETKDATEVKDTTTEVKDPTETKDTTEVKDSTDTKDTTTEVKTPSETKDSTETKDATDVKDTTGDKTGEKDAKDAKGSTTGKKKGSTYGKHARQDDGTDSTASASTGSKTSTGGKHRKPEGGSSEGSSASSAGEHSSAA